MKKVFDPVFVLCYDGENQESEKLPKDPPGNTGNAQDTKTFTQDELNKILAEDKRKHQEKYQQLEISYKELLQNQNLTKEDRDKLQSRLEDAQKMQRSKEQQIEHDRKKAEEQYQTELKTAEEKASFWESLFKKETVARSLQDAAAASDAFNPTQIVGLLRQYTELKDVDGKLTPMVEFPDIDEKTGEEISTLRTPLEAVKRMRELPKLWGNLFKSNVVSGVGAGNAQVGNDDNIDYSNLTPEEYRKHRDAIKKRLSR